MTLQLTGIKTNDGYFLSDKPNGDKYTKSCLPECKINGFFPEPTFHPLWVFTKQQPETISVLRKHPNINLRYELIDKSMASEKIPLEFLREEVSQYIDYEWIWNDEYAHLKSLYKLASDPVEPTEEQLDFTLTILAEADTLKKPVSLGNIQKTKWSHDGLRVLSTSEASTQLIDKIIFPEILHPSLPCELSSNQLYKLVRQHVKDNINPKVAKITSDYDFCFTVKKIIPLAETKSFTVDVNNHLFSKRKKRPKYETKYVTTKEVEIFEMTSDTDKYIHYPVINGLRGNDHEDLKHKLDKYLNDLMDFINHPVTECQHCKGLGVIFPLIK